MGTFTSLAGHLLIAMPSIRDPNFERSVVLICAHSEQGAMGFVLNKLAPLTMFSDLIEKTDISDKAVDIPADVLAIPVRLGGPVDGQRGFVVHSEDYAGDDMTLVVPGGYVVSATIDVLRDIALQRGPQQRLITLGYSGWTAGQLENEILNNGWLHCAADHDLVFQVPIERKYDQAMVKLGINPQMLSSEAGHG
jgi:putative transcriptional regulator